MGRPSINNPVYPMTLDNKRRLIQSLGILPTDGKPYRIVVEPTRVTRSNAANAYYHAVVIKSLQDFMRDQGQEFTHDECHEFFKCKFLLRDLVNPATGEVVGRAPRSTTTLSKEEFGQFLERAIGWLGDTFGVIVPEPGEYTIGGANVRGINSAAPH